MAFIRKFVDDLAAHEDETLVKSLLRDYWILPQISMMFPYWSRRYRIISIGIILFHCLTLVSHFTLLAYSVLLSIREKNWKLVSLTTHFGLLVFFGIFNCIIFNVLRPHLAKQHKILYNDVGLYMSGRIYSEETCIVLRDEFQRETRYFLLIPVLVGAAGGVIIGVPYLWKSIQGIDDPYSKTGINLNLPVPAWYPFPTHSGVLHVVAFVGQILTMLSISVILFTALLMLIDVSQKMRYEFRVIIYGLNTLSERAAKLYCLKNPGKEDVELDDTNYDYQRVIEKCLRDTLVHHRNLIDMIATYESEISFPIVVAYSIGLGVIAICLLSILNALEDMDYGGIFTFTLMIIAEVLTMFLLSLLGTLLTSESEALRDELYSIEWYNLDLRNKKTVLNFLTAITQPLVIKGVGLVPMDMNTFASLMNSAYSFFSIMNV